MKKSSVRYSNLYLLTELMTNADTIKPGVSTLRPQDIDKNDFLCGYNLARVASIDVINALTGHSAHSLRMGYIAYVALHNNHFPDIDYIKAAEFAESLGLGEKTEQ